MTRSTIAAGAIATGLVLLALAAGYRARERDVESAAVAAPPETAPSPAAPLADEAHQGFLYGRITADGGASYEGRLRWGDGAEAFWGDSFYGVKDKNPWAAHVPRERLPKVRRPIEVLGIPISRRERPIDLGRPFMARFGDILRIEGRGRDVRVTLKSGTVVDLDRLESSDFDDGVRVWDGRRGVVDLDSLRIRAIDLLPTARLGDAPGRLHGTVRTRQGEFTGFVQWDREECVGSDELDGRTGEGEVSLRFETLRSIARLSSDSSQVTLRDGREIVLSGTNDVGRGHRGVYVDDRRYGRVLISWDVFERVDFSPGGSGPAYGDFPPGRPLTGSVTTRAGRRLAGRLVYDLDESETTDTLDAPSQGVSYTIPFDRIASIVPPGGEESGPPSARVTLRNGEELQLERAGDLSDVNAGLLIFVDGQERPEYVPWTDVEQVDFDPPDSLEGRVKEKTGTPGTTLRDLHEAKYPDGSPSMEERDGRIGVFRRGPPGAAAAQIPHLRIEPLADLERVQAEAPHRPAVDRAHAAGPAGALLRIVRHREERPHLQARGGIEIRVHAVDAVRPLLAVPAGGKEAHARLLSHTAANAQHAPALAALLAIPGARPRLHQPQSPGARAARQPRAPLDGHRLAVLSDPDAPRKERPEQGGPVTRAARIRRSPRFRGRTPAFQEGRARNVKG